jgi:glyoxylase-like metal-dependent hydrolase (beta-lactamase superfamily II)
MGIKTISLPFPYGLSRVNCYLIGTDEGYVLIDTGASPNRAELIKELESSGCKPGLLKLIVLTHGDFDHTGNAAYLRAAFGGKIAMHSGDLGMVKNGDMFANRRKSYSIVKWLAPIFSGFGRSERFTPDLFVQDGEDLSGFGIDARVLSIPGHSKGSIGILTSAGDLFCGDLLVNSKQPALNSLIDDIEAANASMRRLGSLGIGTVYPGHGNPFPVQLILQDGA